MQFSCTIQAITIVQVTTSLHVLIVSFMVRPQAYYFAVLVVDTIAVQRVQSIYLRRW